MVSTYCLFGDSFSPELGAAGLVKRVVLGQ